jgi:DNA-binding response OmpR family regulator
LIDMNAPDGSLLEQRRPALGALLPAAQAAAPLTGRRVMLLVLAGGAVPGLPAALAAAGCAVQIATDVVDARRVLTMLGEAAALVVDAPTLPAVLYASLPVLARQTAVVVCTPRAGTSARIELLAEGADAVVCPADPAEVVAVLGAVLRRSAVVLQEPAPDVLSVGDLEVHLSGRVATAGGRSLRLTSLEFDLLAYFAARPGESLTRERLLCDVWGYDVGGLDTVTVHVRRLRTKIEQDPSRPVRLQTVWGVGYRLCLPVDPVPTVLELVAAAG